MGRNILIVGLGGFLGSVARFLLARAITLAFISSFPLGTFIVNITGCFIIGMLYGISVKFGWMGVEWRLLLVTGFCGGYTTFSSFAYENIELLQGGNYLSFGAYTAGSILLGFAAVFLGLLLFK